MLMVINREQLLDSLIEIFQEVQEIQKVIGQLVSRTFQNRQNVGHVV